MCRIVIQCLSLLFSFLFRVHAVKLRQVTQFTKLILHCRSVHGFVSLLFARGDTAMPGGLHARLCHAYLVLSELHWTL